MSATMGRSGMTLAVVVDSVSKSSDSVQDGFRAYHCATRTVFEDALNASSQGLHYFCVFLGCMSIFLQGSCMLPQCSRVFFDNCNLVTVHIKTSFWPKPEIYSWLSVDYSQVLKV